MISRCKGVLMLGRLKILSWKVVKSKLYLMIPTVRQYCVVRVSKALLLVPAIQTNITVSKETALLHANQQR